MYRIHAFALISAIALNASVSNGNVAAQELRSGAAASQGAGAPSRFLQLLQGVEQSMDTVPSYQVEIGSKWSTTHEGQKQSATYTVLLVVANGADGKKKLRIEVSSDQAADSKYLVVADGKDLYRGYLPSGEHFIDPQQDPVLSQLEADATTIATLQPAGVDFLVRENLAAAIESQLLRAPEDLGDESIGNDSVAHFAFSSANAQDVQVWVSTASPPLPVQLAMTRTIAVSESEHFEYQVVSKLAWNLNPTVDANTFAIPTANQARRLDEHADEAVPMIPLAEVGQPFPSVELKTFEGKPLKLTSVTNGKPAAIYLWATWAAPSLADIPTLNQFVERFQSKGAQLLAVNVGESVESAGSFVRESGYQGPLAMDVHGDLLAACGCGQLPVTILLDGKGNFVDAIQGSGQEAQTKVAEKLTKLLQGSN
jgi:thiol-disulfide isomerase/thioredoxin